ncbi:hypothetical protein P167DRAFT_574250 [Morchella conica CCBAS932]|uniref:RNase H type-1 domain-containing protein n=1 Tax=Morchella conica CCBAS932 TaxID=1392247 RepID=A0A3N4KST2_9PEZI|nr:hypothetical protein P167DRAFT_574250 [Morchella conica CCBAS932]
MLGFGDHAKISPVDIVNYNNNWFTLAHPTWIDDRWNRFEDPATVIIHTSGSFSVSSSSASSAIYSSSQETHAYGTVHTRANSSWGIYHGPGSTHNRSGTIPTSLPQSKPHADLYAAGMALEHFRNFILPCMPPPEMMWRNAIIVTDSAYLLSCLTQNIEAWRLNGYKNAKKKVVSNAQTIRWLEDLVENLEKNCVSVVFWKVEKKENSGAVSMGKRALERQEFWNVENQVPSKCSDTGMKRPLVAHVSLCQV